MAPDILETPVVVRLTLTPTASLTLKTARIAALSSLLVQASNGKMFVSIDDLGETQPMLSMVQPILDSLRWLGCTWEGEIIYRSRRVDIYQEFARKLLASRKAYHCFCRRAVQVEDRLQAEGELATAICSQDCLALSETDVKSRWAKGEASRVLLHVSDPAVQFHDLFMGPISKKSDDVVVMTENDCPARALVEAVDDHELGVTHAIHEYHHLAGTIQQIQLCRALGWNIPRRGHMPEIMVSGERGKAERFRVGNVAEYQRKGIIGEVLRGYLQALGWTAGKKIEIHSHQQLMSHLIGANLTAGSATFDEEELVALNKAQIRTKTDHELAALVAPLLVDSGVTTKYWLETRWTYLRSVVGLLKDQASRLTDFVELGGYFFFFDFKHQVAKSEAHFTFESTGELELLARRLANLETWSRHSASQTLGGLAGESRVERERLELWTRLAVSGKVTGPELGSVLELLSQPIVVERMKKAIDYLRSKHKL